MENSKFKWSRQAKFLAEKANLTADDIRRCEKYAEEKIFIIGGQHILDWLNWKFNSKRNPKNHG